MQIAVCIHLSLFAGSSVAPSWTDVYVTYFVTLRSPDIRTSDAGCRRSQLFQLRGPCCKGAR